MKNFKKIVNEIRMNKYSKIMYVFIANMIIFSITCHAQQKERNLLNIYSKYINTNSPDSKKDFFYAFPNSFSAFQEIYGYNDKKGAAPLYSVAREHMSLFFKTADVIDNKIFFQKILNISKNGKWDADAVNYFQSGLREYFFINNKLFLELLTKNNKHDIYKFWYFFSDGPHFNNNIYTKTIEYINKDQSMKKIYLDAIQQVKKDNNH